MIFSYVSDFAVKLWVAVRLCLASTIIRQRPAQAFLDTDSLLQDTGKIVLPLVVMTPYYRSPGTRMDLFELHVFPKTNDLWGTHNTFSGIPTVAISGYVIEV